MSVSARHTKPDLRALTGLRGIAAWFVVFYHIRTGMHGILPDSVITILAKGYLAVDFFFILSGFVMWLSYADRFSVNGLSYTGSFYWRRIARIWPLHIFVLSLVVGYVGVLAITNRYHPNYPLTELPTHIFLLQNWGFTENLSWNHPAWSISAEMGAYLIFPILAIGARWHKFSNIFLICTIIILGLILHLFFAQRELIALGQNIPQTGLFRCLIQFIIGTILCELWKNWRGDSQKATVAITLGLALFGLFALGVARETLLIPLSFSSLVLGSAILAEQKKNPFGRGFLHYLGEISYATYLSHFMLYIWFKIAFVDDPLNVAPQYIVGYILLTFTSSIALYHGIEKPGQTLLQKFKLPSQKKLTAE